MAPEPEGNGAGMAEGPEHWGAGGLVGDGRYRLTHRLGRGGMAEVFAAEDVRLGRTVAVKLLRADLRRGPGSKARFRVRRSRSPDSTTRRRRRVRLRRGRGRPATPSRTS